MKKNIPPIGEASFPQIPMNPKMERINIIRQTKMV
ncbi:MAG: hypothetical protein ACI94Y_002812 [Maribacter sp.]|jgi:hypothetical protein